MSVTHDLCCPEMKLKIWIGQGTPFFIYSGEPLTMQHLSEFLVLTQGKPLVFVDHYYEDEEILDCEYYRGVK